MATKEKRAMTKLAACLGLGAIQAPYRLRQSAFGLPAVKESFSNRLFGNSCFFGPFGQRHCFSVERYLSLVRLVVFVSRFIQGFFNGPSSLDPILKGFVVQSTFGGPISKALRFAKCCDKSIRTLIPGLLFPSSPFAVVLGISESIIFSFKCVLRRWSPPHVSVENFERIPFRANGNTSVGIITTLFMQGIVAALLHSEPYCVFWRAAFPVSDTAAASATTASSSRHCWSMNNRLAPAVAQYVPVGKWWLVSDRFVYDCPLAKSLTSQIYEAAVATNRIVVSHDFVPIKQVVVRAASQLQLIGCSYFSSLAIRDQR